MYRRKESTSLPGSKLLLIGMALWALVSVIHYPRTFAIVDEDAYLTQAYLFRTGRLSYEDSRIPAPHMTVESNGRLVSKYPPGTSLLLLPFTFAGWRATFAAGLLLALAGTWLFARILRRLAPDADPAWSLLWLCYPTVTLYSRTLMSDLPATVFIMAGLLALLRRQRFTAGLALGAAILIRYSNGLFALIFALILLAIGTDRRRGLALLLLGLLPGIALALGYNWYCYGGPLSFPMYLTGLFAPGFFPRNALYYGRALLLMYPLMLLAPLLVRGRYQLMLALLAYPVLILYCFFSYIHTSPDITEQITVGLRYLLPGLGFLILAATLLLHQLEQKLSGFRVVKYILLGIMLATSLAVHWRHDRYLAVQAHYRRLVYRTVPETSLIIANAQVTELISHAWGDREYRRFVEFNIPMPLDSVIAAADDPWALLIHHPGRVNPVEQALFLRILARHPDREPVVREDSLWHLEIWRLNPSHPD